MVKLLLILLPYNIIKLAYSKIFDHMISKLMIIMHIILKNIFFYTGLCIFLINYNYLENYTIY
jgi:hypothetical protein